MLDARQQAESMQLRYRLLPILFTQIDIETERGDVNAANQTRARTREIIAYIAEHTPEDLRESFLNLPKVKSIVE